MRGLTYQIDSDANYYGLSTADHPPLVAVDIWAVWYRVPPHLRRKVGRLVRHGRLLKWGQMVSWGTRLNPAQIRALKAALDPATTRELP